MGGSKESATYVTIAREARRVKVASHHVWFGALRLYVSCSSRVVTFLKHYLKMLNLFLKTHT